MFSCIILLLAHRIMLKGYAIQELMTPVHNFVQFLLVVLIILHLVPVLVMGSLPDILIVCVRKRVDHLLILHQIWFRFVPG